MVVKGIEERLLTRTGYYPQRCTLRLQKLQYLLHTRYRLHLAHRVKQIGLLFVYRKHQFLTDILCCHLAGLHQCLRDHALPRATFVNIAVLLRETEAMGCHHALPCLRMVGHAVKQRPVHIKKIGFMHKIEI